MTKWSKTKFSIPKNTRKDLNKEENNKKNATPCKGILQLALD